MPAAAAAATGLALGQQHLDPAQRRAAPQQFAVGRPHRPGDIQRRDRPRHRGGQVFQDASAVQQFQRLRQPVAVAGTAVDGHAGRPQPLDTLPDGGAGLAQFTRQGVAGKGALAQLGQQFSVVHDGSSDRNRSADYA